MPTVGDDRSDLDLLDGDPPGGHLLDDDPLDGDLLDGDPPGGHLQIGRASCRERVLRLV